MKLEYKRYQVNFQEDNKSKTGFEIKYGQIKFLRMLLLNTNILARFKFYFCIEVKTFFNHIFLNQFYRIP